MDLVVEVIDDLALSRDQTRHLLELFSRQYRDHADLQMCPLLTEAQIDEQLRRKFPGVAKMAS